MEKIIDGILEKFNSLKTERSVWNSSWQLIAELVNTKKASFTGTNGVGEFLNNKVFSNKPNQSMKKRANIIKSMILGDYDFKLEPVKKYVDNDTIAVLFQDITDKIKSELRKGNTAFSKSLTQSEEFDATFGTSIIYCDYTDKLNFKCLELSECYIDEDYSGKVDTLFREFCLNPRNAVQQFGFNNLSSQSKKLYENNDCNAKIKILNLIAPKSGYEYLFNGENDYKYISLFIEVDNRHIINSEGYYDRPFIVHREGQAVGEKYGRGPSFDNISLISQINKVVKNFITIINRYADPPLGIFDDKQNIDLSAGAVSIFKANQNNNPPVFNMIKEIGSVDVVFQYLQSQYEELSQAYSLDRLLDFNNETRMTATESNLRSVIRNQSLADLFQNKIDEKYTPLIERAFNLLLRNGVFDDLIEKAIEKDDTIADILFSEDIYEISYYNQVKRDNNSQNINSVMNVYSNVGAIAQMSGDISIFDNFDMDKTANLFKSLTFTNEIYRGEPNIKRIREQRAEAQAQAQQQALQQEVLLNQSKKTTKENL
jgi:hypothetical protein